MKKILAFIATAKKALAAVVAVVPAVVAVVAGLDPKVALAIVPVLVALGVYHAPANKV